MKVTICYCTWYADPPGSWVFAHQAYEFLRSYWDEEEGQYYYEVKEIGTGKILCAPAMLFKEVHERTSNL